MSPRVLRTLGPAGQAYFFKVLRRQLDSQFKTVQEAAAKSENQNAATAPRSDSGAPLLISAETWSDQRQKERSRYGMRAVKVGLYVALTLTLAASTLLHFHQDRELLNALIGFLQGISHVLR
ncbi:hypothetical protein [Devosia sp. RR2S18]|uniref:hypothetical protein n=1 Tax=Devosia rhizosphaerae TaxID=3049774 RepID=UPI0025401F29|nr:hypothetical protein [Devosia sp. RR2S18]WIJ25763.1 hypothetical protein QOV41_03085 [Devosia sp. RR2S18]